MSDQQTLPLPGAGVFITFEGTEGGGKSTQIERLRKRVEGLGRAVRVLREPGGTPIGEEIRHTLKHSAHNHDMTPEAELLLMNASRAQLVRRVIQPALAAGEVVLCDRFFDSTIAYQGFGRGLDRTAVDAVIRFAIGSTVPHLTLLLAVPVEVSEERRRARAADAGAARDRFEEEDQAFFRRVEEGFQHQAAREPGRIRVVQAGKSREEVELEIWQIVRPLFPS